jgi:hypothetical protein
VAVRIFKTRSVARYCKSEGITDAQLADAIARAERGLVDAVLGGGLIKQRVARKGQGKSGGWRTLIAYRAGDRAVFLFGFAKNQRDNVGPDQLTQLKAAANEMLTLPPKQLSVRLTDQTLIEVAFDKED